MLQNKCGPVPSSLKTLYLPPHHSHQHPQDRLHFISDNIISVLELHQLLNHFARIGMREAEYAHQVLEIIAIQGSEDVD